MWWRPDQSSEELLNWVQIKLHLEILRQCHWQNCGCNIKTCLGLLIMQHHLRRKQFQKIPYFNQFTSFCINVPILNSKFLICTYCHIRIVIYNCQSTRYVVLQNVCLYRTWTKNISKQVSKLTHIMRGCSLSNYLHTNKSIDYNA